MDVGASSFHASEPGHLPLGELVYRSLKLSEHLVVSELSDDVKSDKLVF